MKKGPVHWARGVHSARPMRCSPTAREPARARQVFKPDGRGPWVSGTEEGERGGGMTGELTGEDSGHGDGNGGQGWTQR